MAGPCVAYRPPYSMPLVTGVMMDWLQGFRGKRSLKTASLRTSSWSPSPLRSIWYKCYYKIRQRSVYYLTAAGKTCLTSSPTPEDHTYQCEQQRRQHY